MKRTSLTAEARALGVDADLVLVRRILGGDPTAFEQLMRLHNMRLFRAARAILRNDADAEDVLQEGYIAAYRNLSEFRGDSRLATWLTRIVINQALGRLRSRRRDNVVELLGDAVESAKAPKDPTMDDERVESPEASAMRSQLRRLLERKIDELPLAFRTAFMLREVEEMTIEEAAECLSIPPATVRTRVFRARALLRASLAEEIDVSTADVFSFAGARCDRIVVGVFERLRLLDTSSDASDR